MATGRDRFSSQQERRGDGQDGRAGERRERGGGRGARERLDDARHVALGLLGGRGQRGRGDVGVGHVDVARAVAGAGAGARDGLRRRAVLRGRRGGGRRRGVERQPAGRLVLVDEVGVGGVLADGALAGRGRAQVVEERGAGLHGAGLLPHVGRGRGVGRRREEDARGREARVVALVAEQRHERDEVAALGGRRDRRDRGRETQQDETHRDGECTLRRRVEEWHRDGAARELPFIGESRTETIRAGEATAVLSVHGWSERAM